MLIRSLTTLVAFLFFFTINLDAQKTKSKENISGQWLGHITQDEGGYRSNYNFEIYLNQEGNKVSGRSYVYIEDIYAIIELKGTIKGGKVITLEETIILDHRKHKDMEWCIKKYTLVLKLEGDKLKLDGFWSGDSTTGACIPGEIYLKKVKPRA